jgi:hypothetical protein
LTNDNPATIMSTWDANKKTIYRNLGEGPFSIVANCEVLQRVDP